MIENDLFDENWRTRSTADQVRYVVLKWTFCFAIGVLTGIAGFFNNLAVENVAGFKHGAVSALVESGSHWTAFWVFAGSNLALLLFATSVTAFVSPAAGGSGIPEVKAYLNGVDAPNIFSLRTLTVKVRARARVPILSPAPAHRLFHYLPACLHVAPSTCYASSITRTTATYV
jgi:chloride channel 7